MRRHLPRIHASGDDGFVDLALAEVTHAADGKLGRHKTPASLERVGA